MVDTAPTTTITNSNGGGGGNDDGGDDDNHKRHHHQQEDNNINNNEQEEGSDPTNEANLEAAATSLANLGSSSSNKRVKREWLAFRGNRHTRVGDDYQVAVLPTPVATTGGGSGDDSTSPKKDSKTTDGKDKQ